MKKKNGFTLVELIAAITILGVLLLIGSQVVIDTMNKNKAKAVYTSMDNVSKQARLTFLDDPETWKGTTTEGQDAIISQMNFNENDMLILRDGSGDGSRIVCLGLDTDNGKFKNLKLEYFNELKNKEELYCSYDRSGGPTFYYKQRDLDNLPSGKKTFIGNKRDDDYFFYLTGANCNDYEKLNAKDYENYKVNAICKIFVSQEEYDKYKTW